MFKKSLLFTFLLLPLSCEAKTTFIPEDRQTIISDTTGIPDPQKNITKWRPTKKDTDLALIRIYKFLMNAKNNGTLAIGKKSEIRKIVSIKDKYNVQFIGIIRGGVKYIYCNFFPVKNMNHIQRWKEHHIIVLDGGYWYWNIEYNLEADKCENMRINGYG